MSSSRESVGDLIPPDVLQVFTEERQGGRSKRGRRRAASFTRAFKWLKSQRRKPRQQTATIRGDLLAAGSPVDLPPPSLHSGQKVEAVRRAEFQENVFVEGNRPKHVLALHTEAQQGLKLQQQEDDKSGTDFPDDQSVISSVTAQSESSVAFSELRVFESDSTATDAVSMRSTVSSRSTRSGLRRQASTFRPLKPEKAVEKSKPHRRHVRTVLGIPRHIQKELGLDRAAWITASAHDGEISNGEAIPITIVSSVDEASSSSENENESEARFQDQVMPSVKEEKNGLSRLKVPKNDLEQHPINASDDPDGLGALLSDNPSGAVMSISPQATYMSKIIPNAVMPPSVDVVELSRNRSRSSLRTVSKSSLVSASPASTRASSRLSNFSSWSRTGSSETLVSDSSTISSSSTPRVASRQSQIENTNKCTEMNQQSSLKHTRVNGDEVVSDKKPFPAGFSRNLSVIKRNKKPPAPPSRSYSLHNGRQPWKRSGTPDGSSTDGSVILSGISKLDFKVNPPPPSDNDTVTKLSNGIHSVTDTEKLEIKTRNGKLAEIKKSLLAAKTVLNGKAPSPAVMALITLLDIPAHPNVPAPPAPPPETWAHNQHTFELLCGPGPVNFTRWAKKRGLKLAEEAQMIPEGGPNGMVHPSPSPPPDHNPPTPTTSPNEAPSESVPSGLVARAMRDLTSWIPPPPLFPPPAPPVAPVSPPNDGDFPPPPPPFSPPHLQTLSQFPPDVPPPPPDEIPPSPKQPKPPKPSSETQEHASMTEQTYHGFLGALDNVPPPPPPLPAPPSINLKMEARMEPTEKDPPKSSSSSEAKEETSAPIITQSLLQMVRLRSVKTDPTVDAEKPTQPKMKSGGGQEAPPKPIRRSLILASLPADVEVLCSKETKVEPDAISTTPSKAEQVFFQLEMQTVDVVQVPKLEPKSSSVVCEPEPASAEPEIQQPEPKLTSIPVEVPEPELTSIPVEVPEPELTSIPVEVPEPELTKSVLDPNQPDPSTPELNNNIPAEAIDSSQNPEKPARVLVVPPELNDKPLKVSSPPPANPSMRLQDAIRLKTAARSSADHPVKRFGSSTASTASFIFSKSSKKVVMETPSSPEAQADLRKNLLSELTNKVPPPIAKKPKAKVENVTAEIKPGPVQSHAVPTAGQEVQEDK